MRLKNNQVATNEPSTPASVAQEEASLEYHAQVARRTPNRLGDPFVNKTFDSQRLVSEEGVSKLEQLSNLNRFLSQTPEKSADNYLHKSKDLSTKKVMGAQASKETL